MRLGVGSVSFAALAEIDIVSLCCYTKGLQVLIADSCVEAAHT